MDIKPYSETIKQEPTDFEGNSEQISEYNGYNNDLSFVKTEGTVDVGEEFISLIKADPLDRDCDDSDKMNPEGPEVEKTNEERLVTGNCRSALRKKGTLNKLSNVKRKCPHCEKMITFSSLSCHVIMVHRPVVCDICNKGYSDESTLKRHKNMVHVDKGNDKRFKLKCDYCDERYMKKYRLVRHCRNKHKIFL